MILFVLINISIQEGIVISSLCMLVGYIQQKALKPAVKDKLEIILKIMILPFYTITSYHFKGLQEPLGIISMKANSTFHHLLDA